MSIWSDPILQDGAAPTIVFGAFDRHNFGDLLFAHIAAALLPDQAIVFAGLRECDLRRYGGHQVRSLPQLAHALRGCPVRLLHAGGELLSCSAWEAAIMLLEPSEAAAQAATHAAAHRADRNSTAQARQDWAHAFLGIRDNAPYTVAPGLFEDAPVAYNAVGGADLALRDPALREEVFAKLARSAAVSVRDRSTLAALQRAGIAATLVPDPAVMVAELFGAAIRGRAQHGEVRHVRAAMPNGYLAAQCSADFGEPAYLDDMAAQLESVAAAQQCGIVLFRAGIAPWHDDLECYRQLAARLHHVPVHLLASLDLWDICSLLAYSRAYCGSSLHGRLVALACGRPRVNLRHPEQPQAFPSKHDAFVQTWEDPAMPGVVGIGEIEQAMRTALALDPAHLKKHAAKLARDYRQGFAALRTRWLHED